MKKSRLLAATLCSLSLLVFGAVPASADGMKVVTLGADLSASDQQKMMNYFKADWNDVQVLYITNQDEREHLAAYVPIEQIGTRTVSCAYVKPTTSGGIKVRTANLNWVTGNMIASTLSTSGVKNCEVIAACPFSVSGTGALTGIQMAYEAASGEYLDAMKKQIATEEIVVTGNLADQVGKTDATNIVNKAKMQVIEHGVTNVTEITNIVTNIAEQNNVAITADQIVEIVNLLQEIADQDYDYEDVRETLEHVDENVSAIVEDPTQEIETPPEPPVNPSAEEVPVEEIPVVEEDSILEDIDESILGEDVAVSSTEDQTLEEQTYEEEIPSAGGTIVEDIPEWEEFSFDDEGNVLENVEETAGQPQDIESIEGTGNTTVTEESGFIGEDGTEYADWNEEETAVDENGGDGFITEVVEETDTSSENNNDNLENAGALDESEITAMEDTLSEQASSQYKKAKKFCKGEYENDADALREAMGADFYPSVTITDSETGKKLSKAVSTYYLEVLSEGIMSYVQDSDDTYFTPELNMMVKYLKKLFGVDGEKLDEDILTSLTKDQKDLLYKDSVKFFEKLYGEEQFNDTESTGDTYANETYPEETYVNETYTEDNQNGETGNEYTEEYVNEVSYEDGQSGEDYYYSDDYVEEEGFIEEYDG